MIKYPEDWDPEWQKKRDEKELIAEFRDDLDKHFHFLIKIKDLMKKWEQRAK